MTKGYVCIECGSQIVGHSKADCDAGKASILSKRLFEPLTEERLRLIPLDAAYEIRQLRDELEAEKTRVEMLSAGWTETTRQLEKMLETQADLDSQLQESRDEIDGLRQLLATLKDRLQHARELIGEI